MSTRFFVPCITSYHCRRTSALSFARRRQTIDARTSFFSVPASDSDLYRRPGLKPGRIQMKSDAWHLVFPLRASTPFPELMHEYPFFCSMHHFLPLPPEIVPFICSAAAKRANQLMQEHYFSVFLHQFPDLYRRPGLKPGRIQMKRDARKSPPASVHLFPILHFPKGKN